MSSKKSVPIFSSAGEALMIVLLIVLFIAPFAVATVLTPGYDTTSKADDSTAADSERAWEGSVAEDNSGVDNDVLGADSEVVDDVRMIILRENPGVEVMSYATTETEGHFLYNVQTRDEAKVLNLSNEGTTVAQVLVRYNTDFSGAVLLGGYEVVNWGTVVRIEPGQNMDLIIDASEHGDFELWVSYT